MLAHWYLDTPDSHELEDSYHTARDDPIDPNLFFRVSLQNDHTHIIYRHQTTTMATTDLTGELIADAGSPNFHQGWGFIVLMSRQGKIRLAEFFNSTFSESTKRRILREIAADILPRAPKLCNIIEKSGDYKFVYRRYASLYFVVGVPPTGVNELLVLDQIHLFVEALDGYFNSGGCCCCCCVSVYTYYWLLCGTAHNAVFSDGKGVENAASSLFVE